MLTATAIMQMAQTQSIVNLPPGDIWLDQPLVLPPDKAISLIGMGVGLTNLVTASDGIISDNRPGAYAPVEIRNLSVRTVGNGHDGIRITRNWQAALHEPQVIIENVWVAPWATFEGTASFKRGIVLEGVWGPKLSNLRTVGNFNHVFPDMPPDTIGIELTGCQESKVLNSYVACYATGIHQGPALQVGESEGLEVGGCAIINNLTSIRIEGTRAGKWGLVATPWATIHDNHLFYLTYGVFATSRFDMTIANNSICGSHLIPSWGIGAYIAGGSANLRITGNNFWTTKPGQGHGVVIDDSHNTVIANNTIANEVCIGVWLTPSAHSSVCVGNVNVAQFAPLIDQGVETRAA